MSRRIEESGQNEDWERDLPPLFSTKASAEAMKQHSAFSALQSILYEGTPEEVATRLYQVAQRHAKFKKWAEALQCLSDASAQNSQDEQLRVNITQERARVHFEMQNYGCAVRELQMALELRPSLLSLYELLAKSYHRIHKYAEAKDICQKGLSIAASSSSELVQLMEYAEQALKKCQILQDAKDLKARKESSLLEQVMKRNVICIPECRAQLILTSLVPVFADAFRGADHVPRVKIAENGSLSWSILFLYPPYGQSDLLCDISETDMSLMDCFDMTLFSDGDREAGPPWDRDAKLYKDPRTVQAAFLSGITGRMIYAIIFTK